MPPVKGDTKEVLKPRTEDLNIDATESDASPFGTDGYERSVSEYHDLLFPRLPPPPAQE